MYAQLFTILFSKIFYFRGKIDKLTYIIIAHLRNDCKIIVMVYMTCLSNFKDLHHDWMITKLC